MGDVAFIVLQPHADLSVEQPADFSPDLLPRSWWQSALHGFNG